MTLETNQLMGIDSDNNYSIWSTPNLERSVFHDLSNAEKLRYLLTFGVMAASSHNTQPEAVSFRTDGNGMEIFINKARVLPASDEVGRQACLSVGWTIANIDIAAKYFGLQPEITFLNVKPADIKPKESGNNGYIEVAQINLKENSSDSPDTKTVSAITAHRVNRRPYDVTKRIPANILTRLKGLPKSGLSLRLIERGQGAIQTFAELQARADGTVASLEKFAKELAKWLKPNDTKSPYGMPGKTFGMNDETTLKIIEGLSDSEKMKAADLGAFARASRSGIESAAVVGILTSRKDKPVNWVSAGYDMGYVANSLEQEGITIAIHAGLAEVPGVRNVVSAILAHTTEVPFILFRAGYPRASEILPPHSPRATIDSFLI